MATATEDEDLFYYPPPLSSHLEYCSLVLDHGGSNNPAALLRMQNNNHHTTGTTSTRMGEPFSSSLYDSSSFLCANALKSSSFGGDGGSTFTLTPNISNKAFTIPILPTTTTTPTAQQALYYSHSQAGNHSTTTTTAWNSIGGGGRGSGSGDDPGAEEKRGEPSGMGPFLAHASSSPPFHHHHLLGFSSHSSLWTPPAPKTNHAPSNHTTRTLKPGAAAFSPTTPTSTTPSPISLWIEKEPLTAAFQCRPPPGMGGTGARWGDDPSPPPPVRSLQDLSAGGFCSPLTVATGLLPSPRSSPVWHSANQAVAAACTPSPYAFVPILESNTPDPFRREQDRGYCEVIAAARTNCVVSPYSDSCCGVDDANNNDDYKCNEDELMTMFSLNTSDHSNDCSSTAFRPFVDRDDTPLPPHFAAESPYWINAAAAKTPKSSLLEPNYKKFLAPSPTMTVETASVMTMDQSSVQSNSINNTIRTSSVRPCAKEFVAAPPLYPKPLQESSSYSSAQQQQPPAPMSSLAAAAWTGRACRTFVPSTPPTKNFYAASSSSSSSSLRNSADACVQPTSSLAAAAAAGGMRRHASSFATTTMTRPQSAPTVGRPTIVRTNSNNIIKGSLTTTTASTCTKEEDAQLRKTRLKTELCLHYMSGRPCPFGSSTYSSLFILVVPIRSSSHECVFVPVVFLLKTAPTLMAKKNCK